MVSILGYQAEQFCLLEVESSIPPSSSEHPCVFEAAAPSTVHVLAEPMSYLLCSKWSHANLSHVDVQTTSESIVVCQDEINNIKVRDIFLWSGPMPSNPLPFWIYNQSKKTKQKNDHKPIGSYNNQITSKSSDTSCCNLSRGGLFPDSCLMRHIVTSMSIGGCHQIWHQTEAWLRPTRYSIDMKST